MTLHIFKKNIKFLFVFFYLTACTTKSIYINNCELVKERKIIPKAYKNLIKKKLIPKDIVISDSLVYSKIADFRELLYPFNFSDAKRINRKQDSLYSLSIRQKRYSKDYGIKSLFKNKSSNKSTKYKIYFSKIHDNYIMAEVFDSKYSNESLHNTFLYYGNTMRYLFLIENNKIKKMYSMPWRYGI